MDRWRHIFLFVFHIYRPGPFCNRDVKGKQSPNLIHQRERKRVQTNSIRTGEMKLVKGNINRNYELLDLKLQKKKKKI